MVLHGMILWTWWAGIANYGPRHEADILILVLWVGLESYEWNGEMLDCTGVLWDEDEAMERCKIGPLNGAGEL